MDRELLNVKMARLIQVNGDRTKNMDMDNIAGQMEINTKDNINSTKDKVWV